MGEGRRITTTDSRRLQPCSKNAGHPSTIPTSKNGWMNSVCRAMAPPRSRKPASNRAESALIRPGVYFRVPSHSFRRTGHGLIRSQASPRNQQRFLGELKALLRIPSVSTAPEHKSDVQRQPSLWPMICAPSAWKTWRSSPPKVPSYLCRLAACRRQADCVVLRALRRAARRASERMDLAAL